MSPTVKTDGIIRSDVSVKEKRTETLEVARGSLLSDFGEDISQRRRSSFSVIVMVRKEVIVGVEEGGWYSSHVMDRSGSLREENAERRTCHCASLRSGLGVESVAPNSEAFRAILAASPVVETR